MKKFIQLAFVCLSIGVLSASTSCSSNYDATPDVPGKDTMRNPFQGDFTAVVNGVNFIAETKGYQDATVGGIRVLTVYGIMNSANKDPKSNTSINLNINNYNGPGVYYIQQGVAGVYTILNNGTPTAFLARVDSANMITVTGDGDKIEGSFNFTVTPDGLENPNQQNIADGKFSIPK
ncbi:hypothetical protein [Taibaiella chishuiensis]|uniref:Uncharacterized protein n=1 Tax=Taibaiella chishuiensis TaxID=1434707 RepID=A0A2P8D6A4_9BACT|nr:hypothetical protein [Taibaiella chishuiensis]PSK92765.1 hypothetical protein B0I18_103347 [Taibaiella chishuiensis]